MIFSIIITILALSVMICIHELGHMIAAKCFGVYVEEFSLGMGPKLFSLKPKETTYCVRLLPLGGFVKMEGEVEEEDQEPGPRSFARLSTWKRFVVLCAGAVLNVVLGLLMFVIINLNSAVYPPVVVDVPEEYANSSVFRAEDEILSIDGARVHSFNDILMELSDNDVQSADSVNVTVRRNGEKLVLDAPLYGKEGDKRLMVMFGMVEKPGLLASVRYASYDTVYVVKAVLGAVGDLLTGKQSVDSLGGPVEIVAVVDQVAQTKTATTWLDLMWLFALITVNLGVFNLLPIPALDGGQILFLLIEKIIGKKIKPQIMGMINSVFFALLMLLAVYVTVGDIAGLIK